MHFPLWPLLQATPNYQYPTRVQNCQYYRIIDHGLVLLEFPSQIPVPILHGLLGHQGQRQSRNQFSTFPQPIG